MENPKRRIHISEIPMLEIELSDYLVWADEPQDPTEREEETEEKAEEKQSP